MCVGRDAAQRSEAAHRYYENIHSASAVTTNAESQKFLVLPMTDRRYNITASWQLRDTIKTDDQTSTGCAAAAGRRFLLRADIEISLWPAERSLFLPSFP